MDSREEIKARLSIYDLVSEYVQLKKSGRNFKGLCPFHSEKSPSFMVSPDKEIAYCFGCHKGGDIFAFYQQVENVEFTEALKRLAEKTGVVIETVSKDVVAKNTSSKEALYKIHQDSANFYNHLLLNSDDGLKVKSYLKSRGLTDETIEKYKIGFAPDSYDFLYKKLLERGVSKDDIVLSGLAIARDSDSSNIFDRFRLRLMFPIFDKLGKIVGFGGRALKSDENVKYLNSPETPIYHKSDVLFGFSFAKDAIREKEQVILVEGYFDQILTFQAGFQNVVAVSGTALTERHLAVLSKYAKQLYFCLDTDKAGLMALYRSAELALVNGFNLKVIALKDVKDPAEAINKDLNIFKVAYENAMDFFDFFLQQEFLSKTRSDQENPLIILKVIEQAMPIIDKISSPTIKDIVLRKFAQVFGADYNVKFMYDELYKYQKSLHKHNAYGGKKDIVKIQDNKLEYTKEEYFWANLLLCPVLFGDVMTFLQKNELIFKEKQVYKQFFDYYNTGRDLSLLDINDFEADSFNKEKYSVLMLYIESVSALDWSPAEYKLELARIAKRLVQDYKKNEGARLQRLIKESEKSGNSAETMQLIIDYQKVLSL